MCRALGTSYASFPPIPYCPFLQQSDSRRLGNTQGCPGPPTGCLWDVVFVCGSCGPGGLGPPMQFSSLGWFLLEEWVSRCQSDRLCPAVSR